MTDDDEYPTRTIEPAAYGGFARRIIRAMGRRCAQSDPYQLGHLLALKGDVDAAIAVAVSGLRAEGYSWADIARPLGITRQGARQVYGPLCDPIPNPRKRVPMSRQHSPGHRSYTRRGDVNGIICWSPKAGAWQYWNSAVMHDTSDDLAELAGRWPLADVHVQADLFAPTVDQGIAENRGAR